MVTKSKTGRGMRRRVTASLIAGGAALAAAGCGSSGSDAPAADTEDLVLAAPLEPRSLDYLIVGEEPPRDTFAKYNVMGTLTQRPTNDMASLEPALATEWSVDGTEWTFNLREGITYQDGSAFDADDVVFTIETILDPNSGAEQAGLLGPIQSASKVDDHTVVLTTEYPDPVVPARMALIGIAPSDTTPEQRAQTLYGTGPYEFDEYVKGSHIALKARTDGYFGADPTFESIRINFISEDSVRLSALTTDEAHMALELPPELVEAAPAKLAGPLSLTTMLRLNTTGGGPFEDERLRLAANYAVDRQSIIDNIYQGNARDAQGQLLTDFVVGFDSTLESYPYDPEMAKDLVDEVGGSPTVTMSGSTGRTLKDREAASAIAQMLEEAGFKVELEFPEFERWVEQIFVAAEDDAKAPDIMFIGHGNEMFDPEASIGLYLTCEGDASTYCSPQADDLIASARTELDSEVRTEAYQELWSVVNEDAAFVTLANIFSIHGLAEGMTVEQRPDNVILFDEVSFGGE